MADTLALDLATATQQNLPNAERARAFRDQLVGIQRSVVVASLTPGNRVLVQSFNALLDAIYGNVSLFPKFVAGMQMLTSGPMHLIRRGSQMFQDHVMLKTGTLNGLVMMHAVVGYFFNGRAVVGVTSPSVLVSGIASTPYSFWWETLPTVANDLTAMIDRN